jgi:hypothetical protein
MIRRFAYLNDQNVVITVINAQDKEWCENTMGGTWVETFESNDFLKPMASPGCTYDADRDVFIPVKYYPSWVYDETVNNWIPPIPDPSNDEDSYYWDETSTNWVLIS